MSGVRDEAAFAASAPKDGLPMTAVRTKLTLAYLSSLGADAGSVTHH